MMQLIGYHGARGPQMEKTPISETAWEEMKRGHDAD